jgi:hypothetical protein
MALNIDNIDNSYFIDHAENMIYRIENGILIEEKILNQNIDEEVEKKLIKKLKIVTEVIKEDVSEFKSGVDKILNNNKSCGYKLTIKMGDKIIHTFNGCTDDYKFGTYEENKIKIKEIIEIKKKLYVKLLINIYINNLSKKLKELKEPEYIGINLPDSQTVSAMAGGMKLKSKK